MTDKSETNTTKETDSVSKSDLSDLLGDESQYDIHSVYNCIDTYKEPSGDWSICPRCGLRPLIWTFDNGRQTACGCWNDMYSRFSICAESAISVYKRTEGQHMDEYNEDDLQHNWNHWCTTGEILFQQASKRSDGRW